MKSGVVIASNRLPVSVKRTKAGDLEFIRSIGGLTSSLSAYRKNEKKIWIGWPGIASDDLSAAEKKQITQELARHDCVPVFLTQKEINDYYNGFSNSVLWLLFHNQSPVLSKAAQPAAWRAYRQVNEKFAAAILKHAGTHDVLWVHDYHLMLVPALLRTLRSRARIGFFLHIPFPPMSRLVRLPHAKELLRGTCAADVVGLHTHEYARNFARSCSRLGIKTKGTRIADFPISIDYDNFVADIHSPATERELEQVRLRYRGQKVILGVDRLDPTKALPERLRAYRAFLQKHPEWLGKVTLVLIETPSRTEIPLYQRLLKICEQLVNQTNSEFGTAHWQPVDFVFESVPFARLGALYRRADVAFVTPLRDGMNLVAKEYAVAQDHGVLILSQTAGAADELTEAILVNPRSRTELVVALETALTLPLAEAQRRNRVMQTYLREHTVHHWIRAFMTALEPGIADHYAHAKRRLLLLDYDGTLRPFVNKPMKAVPGKALLELLQRLGNDPRNDVVLVSGRSADNLEQWFGDLPITLAAEHGASWRVSGKTWQYASANNRWKLVAKPVLERYAARVPGAFVEEKTWSLVWHYRQAKQTIAHKNVVVLKRALRPLAQQHAFIIQDGKCVLELRTPGINKGALAMRLLRKHHDFVLAIGDDTTDEDMFRALPNSTHTIKVGPGPTAGTMRLDSARDVIQLLQTLA